MPQQYLYIIISAVIVLLVSLYVYVHVPKKFPDRLAIIPTSQVGKLLYCIYVCIHTNNLRNFFTLISSLSEFISVFKQPTPSVVFCV